MSTRPELSDNDESSRAPKPPPTDDRRDATAPSPQPASTCGARHLIVTLAFTTSCCLSGVVFGWPALAVALKREGAYADKCADDDDECKSQEVALARVFTIGVLCMFGARLPVGLALDRLGARVTVVVTLLGAAIGALLFADDHYAVGFALITGCANGVHVGSMHLAQLFPDTVGSVTTIFNGAHQMGSLVFLAFLGIYGSGVSLSSIFRGYAACLAGFALLHGCVIQPSTRYRKGDQVALVCSVPCLRAHQSVDEENKPGFVASAIAVMKHTVFLPLLTYKATILLSLQFFVATLQPRLAEDGRAPSIARDMVIIFNVFSAVLGLAVGLPVFGRILDRGDTITVSRCATLLAVVYDLLLALSDAMDWPLLCDVPSYGAWALGRMAFFAYFFAHVLKTFEGNFGVAVGLLSFGASVAAFFIVQPLAAVALREDKIAVVSAALIPVLLMTCAWNERAMRRHADDASSRDSV